MNPVKSALTTGGGLLALTLAVTAAMPAQAASLAGAPASGSTNAVRQAQAGAGSERSALGLSADENLVARSVVTDATGTQHIRYDRTFKGLRVVGGDLRVEKSKSGATLEVRKNASGNVAVASVTPKVTKLQALAAGKAAGAKTAAPSGDLVIWAGGAKPVLAYDVLVQSVRADKVPSRLHTIVDASTGKTLVSYDEIQTGTGDGIFYSDAPLETKAHAGGGYELTDTHGNNTRDARNQGDPQTGQGPAGDLFVDSDDVWGNGAVSDRASAAVDAHYGATTTFNYYKNVLGRNGIWNDGRGAPSRVHFANGMVNAFWDGSQMSYGDGAGNRAPLTEIDVAGHEMSHGVTENTAGLIYTGDAGGLNEATSDIFGTAVEFYANSASDPGDYLIGEEIDINGDGSPLRYMDKPSKDGASRDCWSTTLGGLNPHYSSGPLNHWFFMASEGSGAKTIGGVSYNSPVCGSAAAVTGAGRDKIEKVWYRTLSTKLTSTSNYKAAREGAIASAKELYPSDATVCAAVESAFNAISVPAGTAKCDGGTTTPGSPTVTNPGSRTGTVGTAISNLTLQASGGTSPYTWTATGLPSGLTISSAGAISGTPTTAGTSSVTVTAKDAANKAGSATFSWVISGAGGSSCIGDLNYSGTLTTGGTRNLASFTDSDGGTLKVCLDGPSGADFDVYLQKSYGGVWLTVAQGITSSADESFSYRNTAGTYRLVVKADSGSGAFGASVSE